MLSAYGMLLGYDELSFSHDATREVVPTQDSPDTGMMPGCSLPNLLSPVSVIPVIPVIVLPSQRCGPPALMRKVGP